MKIIKTIDLVLLIVISAIGIVWEIYPSIIPDWLFNMVWIVGPIALIIFGVVLYLEKKQSKK
ncbi:MAG: hypothetical protein IJX79_01105 [Clostridia bacterium]|nr:hypothetical protein [Clostridia bacterium]